MKRKVILALAWLSVVAVCVAIFLFSGEVAEDSAGQSGFLRALFTKIFGIGFTEFFIRKFAHMSEFAALGFLSAFAFAYSLKSAKAFYWGIVFSFCYAVSDEVHQLFVAGRSGQVRDVFIDLAGAMLGVLVLGCCYGIYRLVKGKKNVQRVQGD